MQLGNIYLEGRGQRGGLRCRTFVGKVFEGHDYPRLIGRFSLRLSLPIKTETFALEKQYQRRIASSPSPSRTTAPDRRCEVLSKLLRACAVAAEASPKKKPTWQTTAKLATTWRVKCCPARRRRNAHGSLVSTRQAVRRVVITMAGWSHARRRRSAHGSLGSTRQRHGDQARTSMTMYRMTADRCTICSSYPSAMSAFCDRRVATSRARGRDQCIFLACGHACGAQWSSVLRRIGSHPGPRA